MNSCASHHNPRKGQGIGIDVVIGIGIFLIAIGISWWYVASYARPFAPFTESVARAAEIGHTQTMTELQHTLWVTPIYADRTIGVTNEPFLLRTPHELDLQNGITVIEMTTSGPIERPSGVLRGKIGFETDLSAGRTIFNIYSDEMNQTKRLYTPSITTGLNLVQNSRVQLTWSATQLTGFAFDGTQLLVADSLVNWNTAPTLHSTDVWALLEEQNTNISLVGNSPKIIITPGSTTNTYTLKLRTGLINYWFDDTTSGDITTTGFISKSTSLFELSSVGLALLIGGDITIDLSDKTNDPTPHILLIIRPTGEFWIRPTNGDPAWRNQLQNIGTGSSIVYGITDDKTTLSTQPTIDSFLAQDYPTLKQIAGDLGTQITVGSTTTTKNPPENQDVVVFSSKRIRKDRYGNEQWITTIQKLWQE